MDKRKLEVQKQKIHQRKLEIVQGLPHLYGRKWYAWARAFYNSRNRMNLLCAANQISKSSTMIRRCVHHATDKKVWENLWPLIWPEQEFTQPLSWYLYPSGDVATAEFDNKWVKEFLPRNNYRLDPNFGWEEDKDKGVIKAIHWKNGAITNFKFHTQDVSNLQTATVHEVFADEELPVEMYDEIAFRLAATDGYFNMAFTATLNQVMWARAMEGRGGSELFPEAFKLQVSMYDCLQYDDGTQSPWTLEKIEDIKARCSSPSEVQRRVYGRFITEVGRKYGAFSPDRHFIKPVPLGSNFIYYAAVDVGSGGQDNHPAAIMFLAVSTDYKRGYIFDGWRGDGVVTTSADILAKFKELRGNIKFVQQRYDGHAKDFGTIAARQGEPFTRAEKSHEIGEDFINTLFKNDMLHIFDLPQLQCLGDEFQSLLKSTPKHKAVDDGIDACRYAITAVPWDFTAVKGFVSLEEKEETEVPKALSQAEYLALEIEERRGTLKKSKSENWSDIEEDISYWNESYGNE